MQLKEPETVEPEGGGRSYSLERALDQDVIYTAVGFGASKYAATAQGEGEETSANEWGVLYRRVAYQTRFGQGHYTEAVGHPLADDQAIDSYVPPDPNRRNCMSKQLGPSGRTRTSTGLWRCRQYDL